jgi:cysteine-rich repeat protein
LSPFADLLDPALRPQLESSVTASTCEAATLGSPLAGDLTVTGSFNPPKHYGTDLRADDGTEVLAMEGGKIFKVGFDERPLPKPDPRSGKLVKGWGHYIVVEHLDGSKTLYAHLQDNISLKKDDPVSRGDPIGFSDNSGGSEKDHLHVEYAPNGKIFDKASKIDPKSCINDEPQCGDLKLNAGEQCDDGDTDSGDGCSDPCKLEQPDQITLTLSAYDSSGTKWDIPATLHLSGFASGSSLFFGSNIPGSARCVSRGGESGGPLFSRQVEAGATFYAFTTIPFGEFPQQLSGGPGINRVGCENFVAIKYDDQGNRKVWISASMGAFLIRVTCNPILGCSEERLDWEYQIRYSSRNPVLGTPESMVIGTIPNSGNFGSPAAITSFGITYQFKTP